LTILPFDSSRDRARDPIARFRLAAQEFVATIDSVTSRRTLAGPEEIASVLAELYSAGLRLPAVDLTTDEPLPDAAISSEEWSRLFRSLQAALGDDEYATAAASDPLVTELRKGSLADDLADVYRDVKEGLDLLRSGTPETDVVWSWRFSLHSHWGGHAVEALRALNGWLPRW
jgi:hypothetical protein